MTHTDEQGKKHYTFECEAGAIGATGGAIGTAPVEAPESVRDIESKPEKTASE